MQIQLTGHHLDITDSLRQYVLDKFEKIERHLDYINNVHVILQVEKFRQSAEATMNVSSGELFAKSESDDMYAAIDSLVDKLDRQAIKHKEKMNRHKQPGKESLGALDTEVDTGEIDEPEFEEV
jgi:putative sigma-54 modulation protein